MPQLLFINDAMRPVLLLDGEELVGAKQNRVLNLTVRAAAHAKMAQVTESLTLVRFSNYLKLEFGAAGSCPDNFLPHSLGSDFRAIRGFGNECGRSLAPRGPFVTFDSESRQPNDAAKR